MTLHWWMHWFWVTMLLSILASTRENHAAPQMEELDHITTEENGDPPYADRQPRAMYFTKTQQITTTKATPNATDVVDKPVTNSTKTNSTKVEHLQWTPINVTDANISATVTDVAQANVTEDVTELQNTTFAKRRNLTGPGFIKGDISLEGASESRIVTEKPLSLETTFLQTRIPPNVESSRRVIDAGEGGMDTGAIAGISFAALVVAGLAGSTVFILYRRRYLNKPQTLNDKCSNPDSSGYLDDSTIRDNSEEMYSLDNDSFLNSLEAMTIQNYWTDTVKHTKL